MQIVVLFFRWLMLLSMVTVLAACVSQTIVNSKVINEQKSLEAHVDLAMKYIKKKNWEQAKRKLKIAYEIDPDSVHVHEALALVSQNTGEFELAEKHFELALSIDRDFSRARNNYAVFLFSQQRYEEACKQLKMVVSDTLYDSRMQALTNLGTCSLQIKDYRGAETAFKRALSLDGKNTMAMIELAYIYYQQESYSEANHYYRQYRAEVSRQSARGLLLGFKLADQSKDMNARVSFALALKNLYPRSHEYQTYLREYSRE